jgi:hypothetical protein
MADHKLSADDVRTMEEDAPLSPRHPPPSAHGLGAYKDTGDGWLVVAFVILMVITAMEYAVGFMAKSTALIAEACHHPPTLRVQASLSML